MKTVVIKPGSGAHTTKDGVIHRAGDPAFQVSDSEFESFRLKFNEVTPAPVEVKPKAKAKADTDDVTKTES